MESAEGAERESEEKLFFSFFIENNEMNNVGRSEKEGERMLVKQKYKHTTMKERKREKSNPLKKRKKKLWQETKMLWGIKMKK